MLDDRPVDDTAATEAPLHPRGAAAGAGRWRLAARLARRELRRRPWRTCLVALLVAAPVMAVLLVDVAYRSHRLPEGASTFGQAAGIVDLSGVDPATFDDEVALLAPDRFEHLAWFAVFLPLRNAAHPDALVGTSVSTMDATDGLAAGIVDLQHGRLPAADDEVLVSSDVARRLEVRIRDELTLVRPAQTFTVVGIGDIGGGPTFLAPGFDVGALRADRLGAEILVGREGAADGDAFRQYLSSVDLGFVGSSRPMSGWSYRERSDQSSDDPVQLFFGWLGGTLLMGAMGIVVGAAFAISGRRQLVTIGQLSATGADRSLLRRFLALQGTWTGIVGAAIGVAGTALVTRFGGGLLRSSAGLDLRSLDFVVAATAIVVATAAALVPARSLATMSTLTALGGRRPVPPLHPRQVRLGTGVLAAGLIGLTLSVVMAREANDVGATLTFPILVAMLAGGGVLIGVCCLGPVWVSLLARVGVRRRGVGRLATRDLDRHRVRSGALIAAVMVVGAAAVAVGATIEQMHRQHLADRELVAPESMADVVYLNAYRNDESSSPVDVDAVEPGLRDRIESVLGHVAWAPDTTVQLAGDDLPYVAVASADLLALRGFRPAEIERILGADVSLVSGADQPPMFDRDDLLRRLGAPAGTTFVEVSASDVWIGSGIVYVSADLAGQIGDVATSQWYGRTDHRISAAEAETLDAIAGGGLAEMEATSFVGVPSTSATVNIGYGQAIDDQDWTGLGRWATINVALLLVLLVVGLGLALESAEGRDDLDTLVALGASPSTLAGLAAWKAGLLAGVGGVLSVPLGYGALWLCVHAARRDTTFPWIVAVGVGVVIPIVVAAVAFLVRRLARPAHRALEPWA